MNRAVFLDRDGVINKEVNLLSDIKQLEILPNSEKAIKLLNNLGFYVIVVANQPQVARGMITEKDVKKINESLKKQLKQGRARIDAMYYCPHHPETHHPDIKPECMKYRIECECRKPKIGMLKKAEKRFNLNLNASFLIGDQTRDILAGKNAGCKTILVKTGRGGKDKKFNVNADFIVDDLLEAAKLVEKIYNVKTLILVGGRGERLRPLTDNLPKPMLPVKGKPILEYLVKLNKKYGIENIVISGHYLFDKIKTYFDDGSKFGANIKYIDDGDTYLGSGGAIRNSAKMLSENFFVMSGDVFTDINLWEILKFHFNKKGIATLVVRKTDHPQDSDLVEIDENFKAIKFYGKNDLNKVGDIANASIFVFRKDVVNYIKGVSPNLENDVIAKIIKLSDVYCYLNTKYFIKDLGTHERYNSIAS